MKGIILAGGSGTRLYPITQTASKQLQPVYDKPMIYYPLSTLMDAGIKDILLISTPNDIPRFKQLLGNGTQFGINISYKIQYKPNGIAESFIIAEDFIGDDAVTLILGDNIYHGNLGLNKIIKHYAQSIDEKGAHVFGYPVSDPERYGVVEFDKSGKVLSIEEKPTEPKSNFAIPGLYVYDNTVIEKAKRLRPSSRGELEITDINKMYLSKSMLSVKVLDRGIAWLDVGTHASLIEAAHYIFTLESRQGIKIGCPEELSIKKGFQTITSLLKSLEDMPQSDYKNYLLERYKKK